MQTSDIRSRRLEHTRIMLSAVCVWQITSFLMVPVYNLLLEPIVVSSYMQLYGDIQANIGRFAQISAYTRMLLITLPASVAAIAIVDKRCGARRMRWRWLSVIGLLQILTMMSLATSRETGLSFRINQLGWRIFGPPSDLYSFSNLVLPRIIAWLLCTLPITALLLWTYSRLSRNRATATSADRVR